MQASVKLSAEFSLRLHYDLCQSTLGPPLYANSNDGVLMAVKSVQRRPVANDEMRRTTARGIRSETVTRAL